jgi:hypothetical protein
MLERPRISCCSRRAQKANLSTTSNRLVEQSQQTGAGFFAGCAAMRIGPPLFGTHPNLSIRESTMRDAFANLHGTRRWLANLFAL